MAKIGVVFGFGNRQFRNSAKSGVNSAAQSELTPDFAELRNCSFYFPFLPLILLKIFQNGKKRKSIFIVQDWNNAH